MSLAESQIDELIRADLAALQVDDGDVGDFRDLFAANIAKEAAGLTARAGEIERDLGLVARRLERLTDALLDGLIDKVTFDERNAALLAQRTTLRDRRAEGDSTFWQFIAERFELALTALQGYEIGDEDEKREILKCVSSNLVARGNQLVFSMFSPFAELREWTISTYGGPYRRAVRTTTRDKRRAKLRHFLATLAGNADRTQTAPNERRRVDGRTNQLHIPLGLPWR